MPRPVKPEPPKRLSLSHVLELLLTREQAHHSSVTLSSDAKGGTQIEVTVRTGEETGIDTVADAELLAREVYDRLRGSYVQPAEAESATVSLTRNAKGDTQIDVQVRTGEAGSVQTVAAAEAAARDTFERLRGKYPLAGGLTTRTPDAT